MKNPKTYLWILIVGLLASGLSACGGGAGIASSWSGVAIDTETETAYLSHGPHIYSVNLTNGAENWRFPVKADNKTSFFAPPTFTSDGQLVVGSYNFSLYSLNPQTGQQNWIFSEATDKYIGSAASFDNLIFAPNNNYQLYALDLSGKLRWEFSADQANWAMPLTDGERLYVASMDHRVYALDPQTGTQFWESEDLGGAIVKSFVKDDENVLYVGTLGDDLVAVGMQNGEIIWSVPLNGWVWSNAVLADEKIFIADQEGYVYALVRSNGAILWQIQPDTGPDRAVLSTPVLVEDTLYFASQAGILYAVDPATGSPRWNKTIGGHIYSDLKQAGELLIVAPSDFDSLLVAVDLQGNNRWAFTPVK